MTAKRVMQDAVRFTGRDKRTLERWAKAGCRLDDQSDLRTWMVRTTQRSRGAARRLIKSAAVESEGMSSNGAAPPLPGTSKISGGAGALQRLSQLERIFFERQLKALAEDRADVISFTLTDYRQICEVLRRFEKEVELARHDPGQLISKAAAKDGVEAVARFLRLSWRSWLSSNLPDLVAQKDVLSAKAFAERTFSEAVDLMMKAGSQSAKPVPEWARDVIRSEFRIE
jgi:hypothetical protein